MKLVGQYILVFVSVLAINVVLGGLYLGCMHLIGLASSTGNTRVVQDGVGGEVFQCEYVYGDKRFWRASQVGPCPDWVSK